MILITGSGGLIGYSVSKYFLNIKKKVIGIENDTRRILFGKSGSIKNNINELRKYKKFIFFNLDIRNKEKIIKIFEKYNIELVVHTAAQPSHDWSARDPIMDFNINTPK